MALPGLYRDNNVDYLKRVNNESINLIIADFDFGFGKISRKHWKKQDLSICNDLIRVLTDRGVLIVFSSGKFTFQLYDKLKKYYKYTTIWDKGRPTGHLNAKIMPMLQHENLLVFSKGKMGKHTYNPQMWRGLPPHSVGKAHGVDYGGDAMYNRHKRFTRNTDMKYPRSIIYFPAVNPSVKEYPTEKPLDLMKYLIYTYSNEGDLLLDPACGSGKSLVAAKIAGRKSIGVDIDQDAILLSRRNLQTTV